MIKAHKEPKELNLGNQKGVSNQAEPSAHAYTDHSRGFLPHFGHELLAVLRPRTWQAPRGVSQTPASVSISDQLNEAVAKQQHFSLSFLRLLGGGLLLFSYT